MLSIPGLGLATSDLGLGADVINTVVKRGHTFNAKARTSRLMSSL